MSTCMVTYISGRMVRLLMVSCWLGVGRAACSKSPYCRIQSLCTRTYNGSEVFWGSHLGFGNFFVMMVQGPQRPAFPLLSAPRNIVIGYHFCQTSFIPPFPPPIDWRYFLWLNVVFSCTDFVFKYWLWPDPAVILRLVHCWSPWWTPLLAAIWKQYSANICLLTRGEGGLSKNCI